MQSPKFHWPHSFSAPRSQRFESQRLQDTNATKSQTLVFINRSVLVPLSIWIFFACRIFTPDTQIWPPTPGPVTPTASSSCLDYLPALSSMQTNLPHLPQAPLPFPSAPNKKTIASSNSSVLVYTPSELVTHSQRVTSCKSWDLVIEKSCNDTNNVSPRVVLDNG